ncbi:MAG: hypothetical protein WC807_17665 [Hyphomicrobium sp.]
MRHDIDQAFTAGQFTDALRLQELLTVDVETVETNSAGKPGEKTSSELVSVAWYSLFARQADKALSAAKRALLIAPERISIETNRAHALMYLGRAAEARALYLVHKDKIVPEQKKKTWQQVIGEDFAALRKAGHEHPQIAEIEAALSVDGK